MTIHPSRFSCEFKSERCLSPTSSLPTFPQHEGKKTGARNSIASLLVGWGPIFFSQSLLLSRLHKGRGPECRVKLARWHGTPGRILSTLPNACTCSDGRRIKQVQGANTAGRTGEGTTGRAGWGVGQPGSLHAAIVQEMVNGMARRSLWKVWCGKRILSSVIFSSEKTVCHLSWFGIPEEHDWVAVNALMDFAWKWVQWVPHPFISSTDEYVQFSFPNRKECDRRGCQLPAGLFLHSLFFSENSWANIEIELFLEACVFERVIEKEN